MACGSQNIYKRLDLLVADHSLEALRGQVALVVVHRDRLLERGVQEEVGGSRHDIPYRRVRRHQGSA